MPGPVTNPPTATPPQDTPAYRGIVAFFTALRRAGATRVDAALLTAACTTISSLTTVPAPPGHTLS